MLVRAPAVVELVLISSLSGGAPIEPQASEYEPIASHELHEEPIQEEAYDDDEDPRVGHAADQEVRGSLAYEEEDNDEHADYDQRESEEALETKEEDIGEPTPPPPPPELVAHDTTFGPAIGQLVGVPLHTSPLIALPAFVYTPGIATRSEEAGTEEPLDAMLSCVQEG